VQIRNKMHLILVIAAVLCSLDAQAFRFTPRVSKLRQPITTPHALKMTTNDPEAENLLTLTMFMIEATRTNPDHADLESLLHSIQTSCKTIASIVSRAGIKNLAGDGHPDERLDLLANRILKNSLRFTGKIGVLASETERSPMLIEEAYNSNYVAVFDPLDGFSNIEAGISTGTIFGIFKENDYCLVDLDEDMNEAEATCLLQTLRPGSNLVASGYCMYSSATILVLTLGQGVFGFTLDDSIGEFILTHPNIRIPNRGKVYSFNEAHSVQWEPPYQFYLADLKSGQSKAGKPYSSRYIGSMVGDIHRTLLTGGVFGYPANRKFPQGKLRLLYEAAPMAFLMEQAGGKAITGRERILDITPTSIDQCTPIFLGSKDDIEELESYVQNKL